MYPGDVTSNSGPSDAVPLTWSIRVDLCGYNRNLISHHSDASQEIELRGFCKDLCVYDSFIPMNTCYGSY
jgi:hypothetical protein